jgi:hypothetical protein
MCRMMTRRGAVLLAVLALAPSAAAAEDPLAEARRLYNQENYEMAIKAAQAAQTEPGSSDEASLILARANLERYRQTHDAANLTAARESLRTLNATKLSPRSQGEFTVGLGEWLFLDDRYGAAAELFDAGLATADDLGPTGRDRVLDWWATAMDRHAQVTPAHRLELYQRIVDRMESELRTRPGSVAAGYWLPAAARSLGDLDRAWQAAIAGWLRARVAPDRGETLRADLDRLVESAIIPERARELTTTGGSAKDAVAVMTAEWEHLKTSWN